jgi:hypothetical protein
MAISECVLRCFWGCFKQQLGMTQVHVTSFLHVRVFLRRRVGMVSQQQTEKEADSVAAGVPAFVCAVWSCSRGFSPVSFLEVPELNVTVWRLVDLLRACVTFLILSSSPLINIAIKATQDFFNGLFHFFVYDNFNIRRYKKECTKKIVFLSC